MLVTLPARGRSAAVPDACRRSRCSRSCRGQRAEEPIWARMHLDGRTPFPRPPQEPPPQVRSATHRPRETGPTLCPQVTSTLSFRNAFVSLSTASVVSIAAFDRSLIGSQQSGISIHRNLRPQIRRPTSSVWQQTLESSFSVHSDFRTDHWRNSVFTRSSTFSV